MRILERAKAPNRVAQPAQPLGRQPALDGVRGVAALLVVLSHGGVLPWGFTGVDIFFVLSGFLITSVLYEEWEVRGRISFRAFYQRRARRLLPALILAVTAVLLAQRTGLFFSPQPILLWLATALLFVSNWVMAIHPLHTLGPLGHTWSLGTEEQFYLWWPMLLCLMLRRRIRPGLLMLAIATLVVVLAAVIPRLTGIVWAADGYMDPFLRAAEPLIGAFIAVVWHHRRVPRPLRWPVVGWLMLPAGAWLEYQWVPTSVPARCGSWAVGIRTT